MIRQTAAIFLDAYRELNSKRMFWIVLILSGLAMGAFATIGVAGRALTICGYALPDMPMNAAIAYKYIYVYAMVGIWLTFGATLLALISVSSIFPDFISGGSIDIFLARPISRFRLFITKYLAGLTFVFLQVLLFALASYFVLGIRGRIWRPSVFLSIPIVLCFFSYLYCFAVFFGVWTRSTLASVLMTVLAWFLLWGVQQAELTLFQFRLLASEQVSEQDRLVQQSNQMIETMTRPASGNSSGNGNVPTSPAIVDNQRQARDAAVVERDRQQVILNRLRIAHTIVFKVATVLPKTTATSNLLDRCLITDEDIKAMLSPEQPQRNHHHPRHRDVELETMKTLRERPLSWIIGTSLAFELVVVSLAAWIFCRRDY